MCKRLKKSYRSDLDFSNRSENEMKLVLNKPKIQCIAAATDLIFGEIRRRTELAEVFNFSLFAVYLKSLNNFYLLSNQEITEKIWMLRILSKNHFGKNLKV